MSFDLMISNSDLVVSQGLLQTVVDTDLLAQSILKMCLTTAGSNVFHPAYGSFLSRSMIGNPQYTGAIVQIAKSQINTCLQNIMTLQKIQLQNLQQLSADEQLGAILGISVVRNTIDARLFSISISVSTKGFKNITPSFTVNTL